jgi:hypothetical protein
VGTKSEKRQRFIRYYKQVTGETDIDMHKVAEMALGMGWKPPKPADPVDILARQFTSAARIETRVDPVTKEVYRANHALPIPSSDGRQRHLWIDIDDETTTRNRMLKCLGVRRENMVGDGVQATKDANRWNRTRPEQEPIQFPLDLGPDVEWRLNSKKKKAG